MAKRRTTGSKVEAFVEVAGYNVAFLRADRGDGEALAGIRLLAQQNGKGIDVGSIAFFPDGAVLPPDQLRKFGDRDLIHMNLHVGRWADVLGLLRNESRIRLYFYGPSPDAGTADLRSLRESFPT